MAKRKHEEGFFNKLSRKVQEGFNEAVNTVKERPQFYKDVEFLISALQSVLNDVELKKDPESKEALESARLLKGTLENAKNVFDEATSQFHDFTGSGQMSAKTYNKAFHQFAEKSINAIHEHQPTLMAAPSLWNKIKGLINNVLEQYLNIKNVLEVKDSNIACTGSFKQKFEKVKSEGKDKMEEIEARPFSPNIK